MAAPDKGPLATPSILAPSSTPASDIYELSVFVFALTGGIFAVVGGLILFTVFRFRASRSNSPDEPAQLYGSTQIELAWTVAPVLSVIVLFLTTARCIFKIQDAPKSPSALDVIVTGHQFWWEFRYASFPGRLMKREIGGAKLRRDLRLALYSCLLYLAGMTAGFLFPRLGLFLYAAIPASYTISRLIDHKRGAAAR